MFPLKLLPLKTLSMRLIMRNHNLILSQSDIWSSDSNKSFLTLTVHFIYEAKLISLTLSTSEMSSNHTAEHIAMTIREILENQWKIYDKVVTIVIDNAANVKKAVSEYLNKRNHFSSYLKFSSPRLFKGK